MIRRGATINPRGRFEALGIELDEEFEHEARRDRTEYLQDDTRSVLSFNDSPDIGFRASVNPYRGCEHGCAYCYARPYHEYLGFSAGRDFETKIMVKTNAPELLRAELSSAKWKPQPLAMSGVTDCYQPVEKKLQITRGCLKVLAEFRNPVVIVTKNHLVTRDIDILGELASHDASVVYISITTLDPGLALRLEPRASLPTHRLNAIELLARANIPVNVLMAPIIPGLTDHEIPAVLRAAREAGARSAAYTMLRLPYGVKDVFKGWLDEHIPGEAAKILGRIKDVRGGKLNDSRFGNRMRGEGEIADQVAQMFGIIRTREGLRIPSELSAASFRNPAGEQLGLF